MHRDSIPHLWFASSRSLPNPEFLLRLRRRSVAAIARSVLLGPYLYCSYYLVLARNVSVARSIDVVPETIIALSISHYPIQSQPQTITSTSRYSPTVQPSNVNNTTTMPASPPKSNDHLALASASVESIQLPGTHVVVHPTYY